MLGDDPSANSGQKRKKNKNKKLNNMSEDEKKQLRKKGKRFCCKRGIAAAMEDNASCDLAADRVLRKANKKFDVQKEKCSEAFAECCKDETK